MKIRKRLQQTTKGILRKMREILQGGPLDHGEMRLIFRKCGEMKKREKTDQKYFFLQALSVFGAENE